MLNRGLLCILLAVAAMQLPSETAADWVDCPIVGIPPGVPVPASHCLNITFPLHRTADGKPIGDETIIMHLHHWNARDQLTRKGTVFFLYGGPGAAVSMGIAAQYFPLWSLLNGEYDIYWPDYRGVGRSIPNLGNEGCISSDGTQLDILGCAAASQKLGSKISGFSVTEIAWDLVSIMQAARSDPHGGHGNVPFTALGISFGTYLLNRVLQIAPKGLLDAAIFDGVCLSGQCAGVLLDASTDTAGRYLLDHYCTRDPLCRERLGGDPLAFARRVFAKLDAGTSCLIPGAGLPGDRLTRARLSGIMRNMLAAVQGGRVFVPATLYRLDRCNKDDVEALQRLLKSPVGLSSMASSLRANGRSPLLPPFALHAAAGQWLDLAYLGLGFEGENEAQDAGSPFRSMLHRDSPILRDNGLPPGDSMIALYTIEFSELWHGGNGLLLPPPTPAQAQRMRDSQYMFQYPPVSSPVVLIPGFYAWNKYALDKWAGKFATNFTGPVMFINGDLDQSTHLPSPLIESKLYTWQGINARSVIIPHAGHTTIGQSPTTSGMPCGGLIITSFITTTGQGPLDFSCLDRLLPLDFAANSTLSRQLSEAVFGVQSAWGLPLPGPVPGCPSTQPCQECESCKPGNVVGVTMSIISLALAVLLCVVLRRASKNNAPPEHGYSLQQ